ncbi:hypothetical protein AX14_001336 [Amanita brunnescens Koide BX004]|nr:hypothetical protein AX14_001336 [Amanita brunnescens Koide BX004]
MAKEDAVWYINLLHLEPKRVIATGKHQMDLKGSIQRTDTGEQISIKALLDSGCTGLCIDETFVDKHRIEMRELPKPIPVYNADGTPNANGMVTRMAQLRLTIRSHSELMDFAVSTLDKNDVFLGHDWLQLHNPEIDWNQKTLTFTRCPSTCSTQNNHEEKLEEGEQLFMIDFDPGTIHVRSKATTSTLITEKNQVKRTIEEIIPKHYLPYRGVFEKKTFNEMPPRQIWDHAIELIPGSKPTDCKLYPLNHQEQEQLDAFLKENLETGWIQSSKSPMASPFFFVKKKDRSLQPVQDYRKLNEMTDPGYSQKMDIRWGYNNIRIKEGDEWKVAFRTNRGLFEPLVMFFGLTNSPATFQTMMNDIFRKEIAEGWVVIYMDDIVVHSKDIHEHRKHVSRILHILQENKLSLKPEKCWFDKEEIEFLGIIMSRDSVKMDPAKVQAIIKWPTPKCKKEVQQFLGFTNFYRQFCEGHAKVAKPLTKLTRNLEWQWGLEQQKAFKQLKEKIAYEVTLAIPNQKGQFRMETDASDFAIATILSQMQDNKVWRPVAFFSKAMNPAERNYEIYDKEMLAIVKVFEEWSHYLKGAQETIEVLTDHQNLTYF